MKRILIANRGEIAVRIARTVKRMGLTAVAVHSEADRGAPHVEAADVAVALPGGSSPRESYLDMDRIVEAARRAGCDAIHPGYGFLSENPRFARRCLEEGLTFIGPPPESIELLGDKQRARRFLGELAAKDARLVTPVPGFDEPLTDPAGIVEAIAKVGYPALIKAAAGGGGRGMRLVSDPAGAAALVESCQREAGAAFGDGRLLVERYVERARHIEVQVFADAHGNVVHLLDRECSAQRRHQKIVEEAPAPNLPDGVRERIRTTAVALARAGGYRNAGTVEFIVDPAGDAFFLEMNTRLQVEHPVTEAVTGLDLVELQIRVARGEALPRGVTSVTPRGHAVEARVYAEDPGRGFLPTTGKVLAYDTTHVDPEVRLDSGIRAGSRVGIDYDPLLLKVIAHGSDRGMALARLGKALGEMALLGLPTNQRMLVELLGHPEMAAGRVHTTWVEPMVARGLGAGPAPRHDEVGDLAEPAEEVNRVHFRGDAGRAAGAPEAEEVNRVHFRGDAGKAARAPEVNPVDFAEAVAAGSRPEVNPVHFLGAIGAMVLAEIEGRRVPGVPVPDRFRNNAHGIDETKVTASGREVSIGSVEEVRGRVRLVVDGATHVLTDEGRAGSWRRVGIDGVAAWHLVVIEGDRIHLHGPQGPLVLERAPRLVPVEAKAASGDHRAPMTGRIVRVLVEEGQVVALGAPLVVLEAMKMEHTLTAAVAGKITRVSASVGSVVEQGTELVGIEADPGEG